MGSAHPEVFHSLRWEHSFLRTSWWTSAAASKTGVPTRLWRLPLRNLKAQLGDDKVILGLSGGVDSSVAAVLLNKAIGSNLTVSSVDHGMLRKNEFHDVMEDYKCLGLNVIGVDASEFFADLAGVTDHEQKRKIIGRDFPLGCSMPRQRSRPVPNSFLRAQSIPTVLSR